VLVLFSVGGRRLAAKVEEVGGVWPWTGSIPVPSGTAFVKAVTRRGDEVLPVFDLAGRLGVAVEGASPLCLIAKRRDGPLAICIDADIPTLHAIEPDSVQPVHPGDPDAIGTCRLGADYVPVYSLAALGLAFRSEPSGRAPRAAT
jgi:chemotaxis signal transduction protein